MNTLSPQFQQDKSSHVFTGAVQPVPSAEVLAAFGHEIPNGLTPHEQYEAIRKAIEYKLSDAAIAGHAAASSEYQFWQDRIDPNLWDKIQSGELQEVLAQRADLEKGLVDMGGTVIDMAERRARQEGIAEDIRRAGPVLKVFRDEVIDDAA